MDTLTFDRSPDLGLALVGRKDYSRARYVALDEAPSRRGTADEACLRQMHSVANTIGVILVARQRMPLKPEQWEVLGTTVTQAST